MNDIPAQLPPAHPLPGNRLNLSKTDPVVIQHVLEDTAAGDSIADIVERYGISSNTVVTIRRSQGETIAQFKADMAQRQLATSSLLAARMEREALTADIDINQMGLAAARLIESAALLAGEPTQRIEVTHNLGIDALNDEIAKLEAEYKGKAIDV